MIKWFAANKLVLNIDKMNIMKFIPRNSSHSTLPIGQKEIYIEEKVNTKFLGLQIDSHINFKNHIEQMVPTLSAACYAVWLTVHISNINIIKTV
jgi:hypothetical protein